MSKPASRLLGSPSFKTRPSANVTHVMLSDVKAIPVREGLQSLYKIFRDKSIKEAIIFTLYFALFFLITTQIWNIHDAFTTNDSLIDLFIDEEFSDANYKKNFNEVMTMEEFWDWVEGPMFNGLYPNEWYNGQLYGATQEGYVLNYYRLVGGVQMRQQRVSNTSCSERRFIDQTAIHDGEELGRYDTKDGSCWDEFSSGNEDTAPYGPGSIWTHRDDLSELDGLFGFGPAYGHGGYVTELPLDRVRAANLLLQMKENMWVDRGTRAVAISFNLYNTNTKLLTVVRIVFEFFPSSHIVHWYKFFTFRIVLYDAYLDQVRLVGELLYVFATIYYLQKEARRMWWWKPRYKYFFKFRNMFELVLILGHLIVIVFWLRFITSSLIHDFDVNAESFQESYPTASEFILLFTFVGAINLFNSLKIFKYLGISKKMNALWLTLRKAMSDLLTFGLGFIVIVLGFAMLANFMFGYRLSEFHNLPASFSTLMRFPLGDFDYQRLSDARPALAALFFSVYVGMVFIVIVNMFIGIITKYFEEVHEDVKVADRWKTSAKKWEAQMVQRVVQWYLKRSQHARWMCPCRRKNSSPAVGHPVDEAEALHLESLFLSHFHKCMQDAKRNRNIDLFEHFENLYETPFVDTDHLYIGVHEICSLVQKTPCNPLEHETCRAAQLVQAYNNVKSVMMVGDCKRHQPISSEIQAGELKMFTVVKVNRNGYKQSRQLAVAKARCALLNFTPSGRLKKSIPLKQLIQLERSTSNSTQLGLVFTSSGSRHMDADDWETTYEVLFPDARRREEFMSLILDAVHFSEMMEQTSPGASPGGAEPGEMSPEPATRSLSVSGAGSGPSGAGARFSRKPFLPPRVALGDDDVSQLRDEITTLKAMVAEMSGTIRQLAITAAPTASGGH